MNKDIFLLQCLVIMKIVFTTIIEITYSNHYTWRRGILNEFYSRNQFTVCEERFLFLKFLI